MDGTALVYDEPLVGQDPNRQMANTLRKQQRGARADRDLNMAENTAKTKVKSSKDLNNNLRLVPQRREKEDTKSVLGSLRHRARQKMPVVVAKGEAALEHAVTMPVRMATNEALSMAWLNIIDSFGLTLIWINIHVLMRFMAGSEFFCKLGHEWSTKAPGLDTASRSNKVTKELLERFGDSIGVVEVMLLLALDFIVLLALLLVFIFIVLLVSAIVYPLETIGQILGII